MTPHRLAVVAAFLLVPDLARAHVSVTNGNYFIGYTDLEIDDPRGKYEDQFGITRVYNSKAAHRGMFGVGWGTPLDTYLTHEPDGRLVIHEYGGGASRDYHSSPPSAEELESTVRMLVAARARDGLSGDALAEYERRVRGDTEERMDALRRLGVPPPTVRAGTRFQAARIEDSYIVRTAEGFVRFLSGGETTTFDEAGRLAGIALPDGRSYELVYGDAGARTPALVRDDRGRTITLEYDGAGHLVGARDGRGKVVTYRYEGDRLAAVVDTAGNAYWYRYDGRYNLLQVLYRDGRAQEVSYHPIESHEAVRLLQLPGGESVSYAASERENEYEVVGIRRDARGRVFRRERHRYVFDGNPRGGAQTKELVSEVNGVRTAISFELGCGFPSEISSAGVVTRYEYDDDRRIRARTRAGERIEYRYDARGRIERSSVSSAGTTQTFRFEYDGRGRLTTVTGSDGSALELGYRDTGELARASTRGGRVSGSLRVRYVKDRPTAVEIDRRTVIPAVPAHSREEPITAIDDVMCHTPISRIPLGIELEPGTDGHVERASIQSAIDLDLRRVPAAAARRAGTLLAEIERLVSLGTIRIPRSQP